MWKQTPLAWKNLTSSWGKLVLSASGVGFAVLLMLSQIGFRNGLFDSTVQIARIVDADLFIVSKAKYNLPSEQRFDASVLQRGRRLPGITSIQPIYVERAGTELRVVGKPSRSIRVIGVPLEGKVFIDADMDDRRKLLTQNGTGLLDRRTKTSYGLERNDPSSLQEQEVELSGKKLKLLDYVTIGTDFVHDGSIVISSTSFGNYFPLRSVGGNPLSIVDMGLVRLDRDTKPEDAIASLQALAPKQIDILTKEQIIDREIKFWGTATPIGIIFTIGTLMGLVVGTIICYQILFTDINDHIAEFATLKAMGYSRSYFYRVVLEQSLYLTLLGFVPAILLSFGLYELLTETTGLIMLLTPMRIFKVFCLTLFMCLLGGILAVRRLNSTDPANLFS